MDECCITSNALPAIMRSISRYSKLLLLQDSCIKKSILSCSGLFPGDLSADTGTNTMSQWYRIKIEPTCTTLQQFCSASLPAAFLARFEHASAELPPPEPCSSVRCQEVWNLFGSQLSDPLAQPLHHFWFVCTRPSSLKMVKHTTITSSSNKPRHRLLNNFSHVLQS